LRKNIHWFETDHLRHRQILVARARPGASKIAAALRMLGATVLESPSVSISPLEDHRPLTAALAKLDSYDSILFSCKAGVDAVAQQLNFHSQSSRLPQIICIGEHAEEAFHAFDTQPVASTPGSCTEALMQRSDLFAGKHLLLITSNEGRPQLARELTQMGAEVETVAAYQVSRHFAAEPAANAPVDLVVLPSSTSAQHLLAHPSGAALQHVPMIAIGPRTREMAQQCGVARIISAPHDTVDTVISLVLQFLSEESGALDHKPTASHISEEVHAL
jgi:uroporphyrinogen III methyltransferase/synthase